MPEPQKTKYGLPREVQFCSKCVMSNQRPTSSVESKHNKAHRHTGLMFDEEGVCDACRYAEIKDREVDWEGREAQLVELLDQYRRDDGQYDILVPGSGGKDSVLAAHILKYKYGMHPLTCTWPPHIYTDIGWLNFKNWLDVAGFDNISFWPNGRVHRLLTRHAFINLLHPFQPFILGQKYLAPKLAMQHGIKLVFYGENEAEYGNPIADNVSPLRKEKYYAADQIDETYLGGTSVREYLDGHGLTLNDLEVYLPPDREKMADSGIQMHYLGYYLKWTPQEAYYYAAENAEFKANPERTEGTYTKFSSLDDRIDGFHYYTTYIKFGIGRATYDAAKDIRNHHITREEGVALVNRFDGEFPQKYFKEILQYLDITEEYFWELIDAARPPHLWEHKTGQWHLRHKVT